MRCGLPASMTQQPKLSDDAFKDACETDIVILVMGATGAGKSTCINQTLSHIGDTRRVKVGEELVSCTVHLEAIVIEGQTNRHQYRRIKGHRIVIVDTPGFDDTHAGDYEILQRIAKWLEESFRKKMVLGGVIYLHDISQDRFSGTARRNLELFNGLCGESALDKVVLVTSKWERAFDGRNFEKREGELKDKHWKTMVDGGARVERLSANSEGESAWGVICSMLTKVEARTLQEAREGLRIQQELVNRRKMLPETHAAKELRNQLQKMLDAQARMFALEAEMADGSTEDETELQAQKQRVEQIEKQLANLKVSPWDRMLKWVNDALALVSRSQSKRVHV